MSYPQHGADIRSEETRLKSLFIIVVMIYCLACIWAYSTIRHAEIKLNRAIQEAKIEFERETEVQAQNTERTEAVPWGNDEAEKNE